MKSNERLEAAAVKLGGEIFSGETSAAAARKFLRPPATASRKLKLLLSAQDGFVTSKGRFVEQDEAAALAQRAGQSLRFGALVEPPS